MFNIAQIYKVSPQNFDQICLEVFRYQYHYNELYRKFVDLLGKKPDTIDHIAQIPFLPISFFKTHKIQTENWAEACIFSSSGTTGTATSRHYLKDLNHYKINSRHGFEQFYGSVSDYAILALLPSYLERQDSSLVYMVDYFIQQSHYPQSGFFLYNTQELADKLAECLEKDIPVLLWGVTYALLDFAEKHPMSFGKKVIVMETGGMKGRRKELLREEVHQILMMAFQISSVHSEYGMTELLSQAYSRGCGVFECTSTMRVLIRDSSDPLTLLPTGRSGGINIIDLANIHSCCFIATDDLGKAYSDGSFEVLGRFDASDIRGCNLLTEL